MKYVQQDSICYKCSNQAWYWHPHIGLCCKDHLEEYFRDIMKLPNWRL